MRGKTDYYRRLDVRRTITDFARANNGSGGRECAFYNARIKGIQRHFSEHPIVLDSAAAFDRALASGATAFYCSYWRYLGKDFSRPLGHDLVWTVRAKRGGLRFAKEATIRVIEALADSGAPEPWVKYSGQLGFDLVLPLEAIPSEAWMGNIEVLGGLQRGLTNSIVSYLVERSGFFVESLGAKNGARHVPADWRQMKQMAEVAVSPEKPSVEAQRFLIQNSCRNLGRTDTCLLSGLRVRRGLLLAPMSLCPSSGLVSVPIVPEDVVKFSVLDASPADARAFEWVQPPRVAHGLMKYAQPWQVPAQAEFAVVSSVVA